MSSTLSEVAPRHLSDGYAQDRLPSMKIRLCRNMNNLNLFHLINTNIKQDVEIFRRERRSTHLSTPGPSFCLGHSVGINVTLMPVKKKKTQQVIITPFYCQVSQEVHSVKWESVHLLTFP